jgi:hypothetical protein
VTLAAEHVSLVSNACRTPLLPHSIVGAAGMQGLGYGLKCWYGMVLSVGVTSAPPACCAARVSWRRELYPLVPAGKDEVAVPSLQDTNCMHLLVGTGKDAVALPSLGDPRSGPSPLFKAVLKTLVLHALTSPHHARTHISLAVALCDEDGCVNSSLSLSQLSLSLSLSLTTDRPTTKSQLKHVVYASAKACASSD